MRFADVVWNNLRVRRLRSTLTIIGIALAVAATVALVSIARGYARSAEEYYRARGADIVVVRAGVAERLTSTLRAEFADRLAEIPGVASVDGSLTEMVSLGEGDLVGVPLHGFRAEGPGMARFDVVAGRAPTAGDQHGVLLGSGLATALSAEPGYKLEIEGTPFTVLGIFRGHDALEGNSVVALLADVQQLMDRQGQVSEFHIGVGPDVAGQEQLSAICRSIEALADDAGRPLGLKALATRDFVTSSSESKLMTAMAYATSLVALTLSLLGVLNTVWMSVLERTRDLGVLRALGWSRRRVMRMIVYESLLLAIAGSAIGLVLARLLLAGLSLNATARVFVSPRLDLVAVAAGVLGALVSGVLGAAYPALRAASVSAAEALRYE